MSLEALELADNGVATSSEAVMKDDDRPQALPLLERYSFMAMTTMDLPRARNFWVDHLHCPVIEERNGEYFIVDAGGLKLCVDLEMGRRGATGSEPVMAFAVWSINEVISVLRLRGVRI